MISKELLSLVLCEEFIRPSDMKIIGNNIMWYEMTIQNTPRYKSEVNLDTLGRLCKECMIVFFVVRLRYYIVVQYHRVLYHWRVNVCVCCAPVNGRYEPVEY